MLIKKIARRVKKKSSAVIKGLYWYPKDLWTYWKALRRSGQSLPLYVVPLIFDRDPSAHTFDKHYVYMDAWAFKDLLARRPESHVDIGSSIRFLSMAEAVAKTTYIDLRPMAFTAPNLKFMQGDILKMPFLESSVNSLSCLHVAEHIGLGRYGDEIDFNGTQKACAELERVLAKNGVLLFALPVGKPGVYFNAHRVHSPARILKYFSALQLVEFSAVDDAGNFIKNAKPEDFENAWYACGMFKFIKP